MSRDMRPYTKEFEMDKWKRLESNLPALPHMRAIPYKAAGSKYGTCGIRIDGNPEFIDAVLSRLKDLMAGENDTTRLELARRPVESVEIHGKRKSFENRESAAEVCYIRLHERGDEAKACNRFVSGLRARHPGASCIAAALEMD